MARVGDGSTAWQILQRIDWLTLTANLEVQLHPVGSRGPHLGNVLPGFDLLPLPYQQPAVMTVSTYVGIAVLDDDQFAVAP